MKLHAVVTRGANAGKALYPHRHADGLYVVSPDRFERNYVRVATESEIESYLSKGYSLRMSNPSGGISAASLISPNSITR